eukprot:TRINITY_DN14044_c0_g1_i1.p1 TRINITY_DN14044_c0_g1~~TRINITY_DN14044_c0_g1_i1.p1  ORF type:complete len:223 (-),score=62.39 TRINITY_DN14044_c0_g1_i1:40-681(-)
METASIQHNFESLGEYQQGESSSAETKSRNSLHVVELSPVDLDPSLEVNARKVMMESGGEYKQGEADLKDIKPQPAHTPIADQAKEIFATLKDSLAPSSNKCTCDKESGVMDCNCPVCNCQTTHKPLADQAKQFAESMVEGVKETTESLIHMIAPPPDSNQSSLGQAPRNGTIAGLFNNVSNAMSDLKQRILASTGEGSMDWRSPEDSNVAPM